MSLMTDIKINQRIKNLVGSTTLAITARAKELRAQGKDVVNFAGGEPDFDTPQEIKQAAIDAMDRGFTKYTPSIGMPELRAAIAEKFQTDNGLTYTPNQIVVSCGAKHSLFNVIQVLADAGGEVIIPTPYWVSYPEMVKMAGATPKFIETNAAGRFKITAAQLEAAITPQTRILLLNSPSNPTGMVYSRQELAEIAAVCVERQIFVISDEIYEKLLYTDEPYTSFAAVSPAAAGITITVNGMSKAYSMTGWRIGYAAGPQEVMGYIKNLQDHSTSNPTSISQAAALQALKLPANVVAGMRDIFLKRRNLMLDALSAVPQIKCLKPDGAFYLFCDISALGSDAMSTATAILNDANVAFIPGEGFGAPGFARLSFATSEERIREGVRRIADWVKKNV